MKEKILSIRTTAEIIDLLKQLAELNDRSQASMIEQLVKAAAAKAKIKSNPKPPSG